MRRFAICETSLKQAFKRRYRRTIHAFVIEQRVEFIRELLETTSFSVSEIANLVRYRELSNFSRDFRKGVGVSPVNFRKERVARVDGVEELRG